MDEGNIGIAVFIDLKKAFDTVDHAILLKKLACYGVKSKELDWFKSYLSNRNQYCYANGAFSSKNIIKYGVPQGSILGPLLFLIYINDLPGCLSHSVPNMYADDTNISSSNIDIAQVEHVLNQDLSQLQIWLQCNHLSLNVVKTEYMIIGSKAKIANLTSELNVNIGGFKLKRVTKTKSLGVIIDENLNWQTHIDYTCKKALKGLGILRRVRDLTPASTLNDIYSSIIQPHFDYCSTVWDCCNKGSKDKLQRLQNRAARIITRAGYDVRSTDILEKLNWPTLHQRRANRRVCLMYKIHNNLAPNYLVECFTQTKNVHTHNTRGHEVNFNIPQPKTNFLKSSLQFNGAAAWNDLSVVIRR